MKIRFVEDRVVQDKTGTRFEAGEVYDLSEPSAQHWIKRGVAVPIDDDADVSRVVEVAALRPAETADTTPKPTRRVRQRAARTE